MPRTPFTVSDVFFIPWLLLGYGLIAFLVPLCVLHMCLEMLRHCFEWRETNRRLYGYDHLGWWGCVKSLWHYRWFFFQLCVGHNIRTAVYTVSTASIRLNH
jgi:hypothetical protein